ncbi:HET-domain-containing protein [Hypoxylon sp. FL1284]|nr:HET-domain-containing protein [Hypoxylon sp. FL1284]
MNEYSYSKFCPLEDLNAEIRVLEIIDNAGDIVDCTLVKNPQGRPYITLSWCLGGQDQGQAEIRIIEQNQPYIFKIPKSLGAAIRMLRYHKQFRVWIDYVCIDQTDTDEKNHQVPMMSRIYGDAERVYVWLGEEADNSGAAMEFIENRVLNLKDFDRLIKDETAVREWRALSALMKRRWFSCRWIVQEITMAQSATILCGPHKIEWQSFADAISLFNEVEKSTRKVSEVMKFDRELGHIPDFFGDVSELSATKRVEETNNLFRRLTGKEREAQFSLEYLVSKLTTFESAEPRDAVYALVAIARDARPVTTSLKRETDRSWKYADSITEKLISQLGKNIVSKPYHVDYTLPLSDIYTQFVRWTIDKSDKAHALDIICRPWAPELDPSEYSSDDEDGDDHSKYHHRIHTRSARPQGEGQDTLPSWIPTVSSAAFGMDGQGQKMTRKNADSLVGLPPKRTYSAAGTRVLTESFRIEDGVTYFSKNPKLNGLHYHSMFQGNIPSDWLKFATRNDKSGRLLGEFWRTIVVDRSPSGENAPRYYPRLVNHALQQGVPGDSLNTKDIVNWGNCSMVGKVLRRVQSSIWNRRLIRTKKDRRFGLAPEPTCRGDLICILYGCSVPVLLRKFTKTKDEINEEDKQRKEKKQKQEESKQLGAVKMTWQAWRDSVARRKASGKEKSTTTLVPNVAIRQNSASKRDPAVGKTVAVEQKGIVGQKATVVQNSAVRQDGMGANQDTEPAKEQAKEPSGSDVYYQLIGECYVDGMMNGEALMRLDQSMLFEIR